MDKKESQREDAHYMRMALDLAARGWGSTSPNPMVGAVVVKDGKVVGNGFHRSAGEPHAEVVALEAAGEESEGATLYVTLEPCSHHGRTPPCTERILESGVERVVVAQKDPNPGVSGDGAGILKEAGVRVDCGVCETEALRQNEAYVKWVTTGIPFVTLKMAMSLDGKTASRTGDSRWISSEESRRDVQLMRFRSDAVMVGSRTAKTDNPRLTVREPDLPARRPLRVVVDSRGSVDPGSNLADRAQANTLVAVSGRAPEDRVTSLESAGLQVFRSGDGEKVDLPLLLAELGERGILSLLVEGGHELAGALWTQDLLDKLVFYIAPIVIGGDSAPGVIGGTGAETVSQSRRVSFDRLESCGPDIKVVAYTGRDR